MRELKKELTLVSLLVVLPTCTTAGTKDAASSPRVPAAKSAWLKHRARKPMLNRKCIIFPKKKNNSSQNALWKKNICIAASRKKKDVICEFSVPTKIHDFGRCGKFAEKS